MVLQREGFRDDSDIIRNKYVIGEVGRFVILRRASPFSFSMGIKFGIDYFSYELKGDVNLGAKYGNKKKDD